MKSRYMKVYFVFFINVICKKDKICYYLEFDTFKVIKVSQSYGI